MTILIAAIAFPPTRNRLMIWTGWGDEPGVSEITEACNAVSIASLTQNPPRAFDARRVEVGDSIQEALDDVGPGGNVVVAAGIHIGQTASPLSGQTISGERGAVLSGDGRLFAFRSSAVDVTITGLIIEGYRPESKAGVVHGEEGATGWTVAFNEVRHNAEIGIVAKAGWHVVGNSMHHNGRYGITGSGADLRVEQNEIACNAIDFGSTSDSGATKFVHTASLVLAQNRVHDNFGNGLWVDINNLDPVVSQNIVAHNSLAGIFIEISCGGLIDDNDVVENGFGTRRPNEMHNAGIFVANSPDVEVRGNRLRNNTKGIGGLHWEHNNRQAVDRCTPELRSLKVHDNQIQQEDGLVAGIDATFDRPEVWVDWENVFTNNEYQVGAGARFRWEGRSLDLPTWVGGVGG